MNLLQVRTTFVKQAGRFDLVGTTEIDNVLTPDYTTDNGADYYINKAHKYLDDRIRATNQRERATYSVVAGQYYLPITDALVIHDVMVDGVSLGFIPLPIWMWLNYGGEQPEAVTLSEYLVPTYPTNPATPRWWARNHDTAVTHEGVSIVPQVLFHAECDTSYTMDVIYFPQRDALEDDVDTSTWSLTEPELLIDTSLMMLAGNILDSKVAMLKKEVSEKINLIIARSIREEVIGLGGKIIR